MLTERELEALKHRLDTVAARYRDLSAQFDNLRSSVLSLTEKPWSLEIEVSGIDHDDNTFSVVFAGMVLVFRLYYRPAETAGRGKVTCNRITPEAEILVAEFSVGRDGETDVTNTDTGDKINVANATGYAAILIESALNK